MLGIGASGPQVIEGFHGVPYDAPLTRTREIIEICRKVWKRERLEYQGRKYTMPLPPDQGLGLGKPLKLITHPVRDDIPIAVAALGEKSVEMTAELADGWLPVFFHPKRWRERWGAAIDAGTAKRDPARAPLEVFVGGGVGIGPGLEHLRDRGRPMMALYVGGMGARNKNFYNDVFASYGYEKEAREIQDLYLAGKKREAEAAIPAEFIEETTLVGPEEFVKDRLVQYAEAGVTSLNVQLAGDTLDARRRTLGQLRELLAQI
jgi:F420-dependent oxidoreductase-like protein